jgi:hypothetical protein
MRANFSRLMRQGKEMDTRFLIFAILSTLLLAGIHSSSTTLAAKTTGITRSCTATSTTTTVCTTIDHDFKDVSEWNCKTNDGGKTWSCSKAAAGKEAIPPGLKDALDVAVQESADNTKVPKTDLNDGGLLKDDDTADTSNDTKVPKDLGGLNDDDGLITNPDLQ